MNTISILWESRVDRLTNKLNETPQRITAETVAEAAKVSRAAVSRAFNPDAPLKPEKRASILRIAEELGYVPDRAARALVTRRTHLVGVIVPDVCSPWESQEIDALTTALQAEGFATLLFKTRTDFSMPCGLVSVTDDCSVASGEVARSVSTQSMLLRLSLKPNARWAS